MSPLATPPGRRPARWSDHVLAGLGSLLAAAAGGAVLVLGADIAERGFGLTTRDGGLLAVIWVLGIGLMAAPKLAWILLPPGALVLTGARRLGLGGWAVAAANRDRAGGGGRPRPAGQRRRYRDPARHRGADRAGLLADPRSALRPPRRPAVHTQLTTSGALSMAQEMESMLAADLFPSTHPITPPRSDDDRLHWLRLLRSRRVGPATFLRLLAEHGTPRAALEALPEVARLAGESDYCPCPEAVALAEIGAARLAGARMLTLGAPDYPALLAEIPDAPPILWALGDIARLAAPMTAVVGARNGSSLGTRMARALATGLGQAGHVVVSGLARGIDTAAHQGALATGTLAVLGGGVDVVYPPENAVLAQEIGETGPPAVGTADGPRPAGPPLPAPQPDHLGALPRRRGGRGGGAIRLAHSPPAPRSTRAAR